MQVSDEVSNGPQGRYPDKDFGSKVAQARKVADQLEG